MLKLLKIVIAAIYWLAVCVRNKLYDWKILRSTEFQLPIIVLGNITVGGTGKTPHTEWLAAVLQKEFKTAILSRGYRRETKGFHYVKATSTAKEVGDEPLQIKQHFPDVTVAVDANRVEGIRNLLDMDKEIEVVLLDDAFQHRRLKPSLSIVLIDYYRPVRGDKTLPWGNLRDTPSQLKRADIVIVTKCPDNLNPLDIRLLEKDMDLYPYQRFYLSTFIYGKPQPAFPEDGIVFPEQWPSVLAVTGIANPTPFIEYLSKKTERLDSLRFPDHHAFKKKDIERITEAAQKKEVVLTTEKDVMRLKEVGLSDELKQKLFYIPIEVDFINGKEKFTKYIIDYVRKNKRNNILHSS